MITMPPLTLQGDTLGEKRQYFNKLVENAIAKENYELRNINSDDSDIDNLLKIAIASKTRNVDYIIEVMKCNDMLYAATAIKKSTWLITEPQYANIINPEYLHTQLLPSMNTKTFNKLMLYIRLNLKDETRAEAFYEYLKGSDSSYKWLQNCSIPIIENVIKNKRLIPISVFRRLCRKSARFLKLYTQVEDARLQDAKKEIVRLLKSHTAEALKLLENFDYFPKMGKKKTKLLMQYCPLNIINHFDRYSCEQLDLSVVAQYLNKMDLKAFIFKLVKCHQDYYVLRPFINKMPEQERFEFVTKTFIDKTELFKFCTEEEKDMIECHIRPYQWYEFAPFNVTLQEIGNFVRSENSPSERSAMLSFLIICARRNLQHIKSLLRYFKDKHINEPFKFKIQFVNNLLSQVSVHEFDDETWTILDQVFHSMEVYTESDNKVQLCLESITLYKVLHDEPVPEIIEQRMTFNSFKKTQSKLSLESKSKMFSYLINYIKKKLDNMNITDKPAFEESMVLIVNALTLLRDWNKDILNYLFIIQNIKELNEINQKNQWKTDMSCLYNVKKSWRKHMFEESLSLCLSEESCLNALKHKPQLLTRHDKEMDTLRTNDVVSLRRLLAKLRVYWPHSLAQLWIDAYFMHLNKPTGQKAVVRGLFALLPKNRVIDLVQKYIPDDHNINWGETDQAVISIRKHIAQNLHLARPLIPLDIILLYAKGDYLQFAVPSINARLSILSATESRDYLSQLLEAPVSMQKFGIKLAIFKINPNDIKSIFFKIWSTTKNLTIRFVLFKHTHARLCKVNNISHEKHLWELLSYFLDNLSGEESRDVYSLLASTENIPISVRPDYFMKCYTVLSSLPASANCEDLIEQLIYYAPKIVDYLDEHFITDKFLSPAIPKFFTFCKLSTESVLIVFASYVLCVEEEEQQLRRFRKLLDPVFNEVFQRWFDGNVQYNFKTFLQALVWKFRVYYCTRKIPIPIKLFVEIRTQMEHKLPFLENYVFCTSWKLTTEYFILMKKKEFLFPNFEFLKSEQYERMWNSKEVDNVWSNIHTTISRSFGTTIVQFLKNEIEKYDSPAIYSPFTDAFEKMFNLLSFSNNDFILETLSYTLNKDFTPSYLMVAKALPKYHGSKRQILRKKIESHESAVVRMHYDSNFQGIPQD